MPSNSKVVRSDVVFYHLGKGGVVESKTRSITVKQATSEVKRLEASSSISEANKAGFYLAMHSNGMSYRDIESEVGKSHSHISGYVHLGNYERLRYEVACGGVFVKFRDLAIAIDSDNNTLTLEEALVLARGTTKQARAGISDHVVLTEAQLQKQAEAEVRQAKLAKDKVASLASQFDAMSLADLRQLSTLLDLAIKAKEA